MKVMSLVLMAVLTGFLASCGPIMWKGLEKAFEAESNRIPPGHHALETLILKVDDGRSVHTEKVYAAREVLGPGLAAGTRSYDSPIYLNENRFEFVNPAGDRLTLEVRSSSIVGGMPRLDPVVIQRADGRRIRFYDSFHYLGEFSRKRIESQGYVNDSRLRRPDAIAEYGFRLDWKGISRHVSPERLERFRARLN